VAHSLSAKKRIRQNEKHRAINRSRKSQIKTQTRKYLEALAEGNVELARKELTTLTSKLDKISTTSTLHKNTAPRIKSRLTRRLNKMQTKTG